MVFLLVFAGAVVASLALVEIRAANAEVETKADELSEQLKLNQRLSAARQDALEKEKAARQEAEQAMQEAEEARVLAEVEASKARVAERSARRSEEKAKQAEAAARRAEADVRVERDKARVAAKSERRAKVTLDRIIRRANDGRLEEIIKDLGDTQ
ncbi:MAG: hypothetical protein MJE77_25475 [Proteobacteria bacterium]|nr:hypothetical protein [Pseudomonadota bacterium]